MPASSMPSSTPPSTLAKGGALTSKGRPLPHLQGVSHSVHSAGKVRLHVAEAGEGPPVVLLHGWPQHWYVWRQLIPVLAENYRVVCPDLRGFGWSEVPSRGYDRETMTGDIVALLDELGIERFRLGGHDWGGWIAFLLAMRHPERVESLLAFDISPPFADLTVRGFLDYPRRFWYQYILAAPFLGARTVRGLRDRPRRLLRYWWSEDRAGWDEAARESFHAQWQETERVRASVLLYRDFLNRDMRAMFTGRYRRLGLKVPTLLLLGADDHIIRPNQFSRYRKHAPLMAVERVEGVGHFIVDEAPELVRDRTLAFFADPAGQVAARQALA
jgi:pimeloyl-ACP methyl ester carboxylesterase